MSQSRLLHVVWFQSEILQKNSIRLMFSPFFVIIQSNWMRCYSMASHILIHLLTATDIRHPTNATDMCSTHTIVFRFVPANDEGSWNLNDFFMVSLEQIFTYNDLNTLCSRNLSKNRPKSSVIIYTVCIKSLEECANRITNCQLDSLKIYCGSMGLIWFVCTAKRWFVTNTIVRD